MCLTEQALCERKWGPFPALRQVLEDKRIPNRYYGFSSASDNMFDVLDRLMDISILVEENSGEIVDLSETVGARELYEDLRHLENWLLHVSRDIGTRAEGVRRLAETIASLPSG